MTGARPDAAELIAAVDVGGSKTDVLLLDVAGGVHGRASGGGGNPQVVGLDAALDLIAAVIDRAADGEPVARGAYYVSGLDLAAELDAFRGAAAQHRGIPEPLAFDNDLFPILRAGAESPDAAAVVCGTGINALAVRRDGATARFAALGAISGDWGGGSGLGDQALWHAARAVDGRGPGTSLVDRIPALFGFDALSDVIEAIHFGGRPAGELHRLAPVVLDAARDGDAIAASLVDRQAEEIALLAGSALRRLDLADAEVPVVLAGGVVRSGDARLLDGVRERLAGLAPRASVVVLDVAPVVGAAVLALEAAGAEPAAIARLRARMEES